LDEEGRRAEIVRLLGGEKGDEYAYKHAVELLRQATEYKNSIN
jgi:DNA repair ATPase RecN